MELTPELTTFSVLLIGFVLGMWGVGHTISLFAVGALVIFLKLQISDFVEMKLEALVGGMLVLLGLNALRKLFTAEKIHVHAHEHGEREHVHIHSHAPEQAETSHHRFSPRSIAIGMVHGLAGSAALMLLVVPTIASPAVALLYILIFGIGSIGGMMAMSFLIGLPMHFTAGRFTLLNKGIRLAAGVFSLGLGALIVYEKLVAA
jgi:sulfite exporter TauE/SafE